MRILITMLLALSLGQLMAQSTTLLPGLVLPQMNTAQRTAIANPANGMLVFDTNTQNYWYRQSGTWTEVPQAGGEANYWLLSGTGGNVIRNTNTGGFWSKNTVGLAENANNTTNPPTAPVNEAGTRLMWIPSRSAFRVGTVNNTTTWSADSIGLFSLASGYNTRAYGKFSVALGNNTLADRDYSFAAGYQTKATGIGAVALGYNTT